MNRQADHDRSMLHTCRTEVRRLALAMVLCLACLFVITANATASFGVIPGSFTVTTSTAQAGAHPDLLVKFMLNLRTDSSGVTRPDENIRSFRLDLPPGITGNPLNVPRCSNIEFDENKCPPASQVGVGTVDIFFYGNQLPIDVDVFNMAPEGRPAELGFKVVVVTTRPQMTLRPDDYGLTSTVEDISTSADVAGSVLWLWGVPADPTNDPFRRPYLGCITLEPSTCAGEPFPANVAPAPYLTNPTRCSGQPLVATLTARSWQHFDQPVTDATTLPPITGCEKLHFAPQVSVSPDTSRAGSPSGYKVDVEVPQEEGPNSLGTPQLKDAVVKLPAGVSLSPAVAEGLLACTDAQLGVGNSEPQACPEASKIGTVTLTTPALPDQLQGGIYIGQPLAGDRYRIFLAMSGDGVSIKLRGSVKPDPQTGQLTTRFLDNPQQPFSRLELHFKGGDRAPLVNPAACGPAVTTSELTPWSAPYTGGPATPSSQFDVSYDGSGGACPAAMPFAPSLTAGVTDATAGASSPFVFHLTRPDRDQTLASISGVRLPEGMMANVSQVARCSNAAATAGDCPASSQIGTAVTGSGAGGSPLYLSGKVFLTDGYKGAPYGLSIVVPAVAGPYDLGDVVVRAAVHVDPATAALSIDADPLPTILDGVPLQLRDIVLNMDRPGFMLNPTNCAQASVGATVTSTEGASANVSSPFQARECQKLAFKPSFKASTSGKVSRATGASLHVKIAYPGSAGQANLRSVKVKLPHQLPSRIGTLQKACPDTVFDVNPAACPVASKVGTASVTTPILPTKLSGPVYFVSHGIAKFPDLVLLLQGEGITIQLRGETYIAQNGVTSTTFSTVPDVPIGSFEMSLPQGPYSALTNNGSLCKQPLVMPTTMTAQNGRVIHQSTRIAVSGCPRHKAKGSRRHGRRKG